MEVLSMLIHKRVEDSAQERSPFEYHWRCGKTKTTHLCFADDLMLLCGNSTQSARILQQALQDLSSFSGLTPNYDKSNIFLAGNNQSYNSSILDIFQFPQENLPVKYLGVPLITSKLSASVCKPLVDSITSKIRNWIAKFLSFAGCLQLIHSILYSIHSFWNGLFLLCKKIINQVEHILRRFLWKGPELAKGGAKVAWEDLSFPLDEGGLGIKRLHVWNVVAMGKHL